MILLLDSTPCPPLSGLVDTSTGAEKVPGGAALAAADDEDAVDGDKEGGGSKAEERRLILAQTLVGELVLATKEVRGMRGVFSTCSSRGVLLGFHGQSRA